MDIATRVWNHNYRFDPYVRSLLDTDFYKILMANFIWEWYRDVKVTFTVKNRSSKKVKMIESITLDELEDQLNYVKSLKFTESELIWLQGNTFYGQKGIFSGKFIDALRSLSLPDYNISIGADGDYCIEFTGSWLETTFWEIYVLAILNEARSRHSMEGMSKYQLQVLYANATSKLVKKLKLLKEANVPRIAEFGTRRRHGFLWQRFVLEAMQEELGDNFIGSSNALHAYQQGIPAIGTNAHELPMTIAAIARINGSNADDSSNIPALFNSQYEVLRKWQLTYGGNLLVALPDTFGSTQFLNNAYQYFPEIRNWTGFREDSKNPFVAGEEKISFWKSIGENPENKLQLFSDGLDVDDMISLHTYFDSRIRDGYGWGTLCTNDFRACDPRGLNILDPISIVCKVSKVTYLGKTVSAVKLSDNYTKVTGDPAEVEIYRKTFGVEGVENVPVIV